MQLVRRTQHRRIATAQSIGRLAGLNEGRLPAYHRLDLNVKRTWKEVGGGELELSAGVTNVYSRENIFYINRITGQRKNQLPFLPSVGLDWSF